MKWTSKYELSDRDFDKLVLHGNLNQFCSSSSSGDALSYCAMPDFAESRLLM